MLATRTIALVFGLAVLSTLAAEGTAAPGALNSLTFTGTIVRARTERAAKDAPAPITLICKDDSVECE